MAWQSYWELQVDDRPVFWGFLGFFWPIFRRNVDFVKSVYEKRREQPCLPRWEVGTWNSVFPALGKHCYLLRFPLVLLSVQRGCF